LFEAIQVNGTIVNAKFVHTEEWDRHILLIQINYFHENIRAIRLPISHFYSIIQKGDPINLGIMRHEKVAAALELGELLHVLVLGGFEFVAAAGDFVFAFDCFDHGFEVKHFPLKKPPQDLIRILHLTIQII